MEEEIEILYNKNPNFGKAEIGVTTAIIITDDKK